MVLEVCGSDSESFRVQSVRQRSSTHRPRTRKTSAARTRVVQPFGLSTRICLIQGFTPSTPKRCQRPTMLRSPKDVTSVNATAGTTLHRVSGSGPPTAAKVPYFARRRANLFSTWKWQSLLAARRTHYIDAKSPKNCEQVKTRTSAVRPGASLVVPHRGSARTVRASVSHS
jgi:hypothetical protein